MEGSLSTTKNITLSLPPDIFKCPVCLDFPLHMKVFQCKQGHLICEQCTNRLQFPACPTCRASMGTAEDRIRSRAVELALEHLESPCPFESRGCFVILPSMKLRAHMEKCLFGISLCSLLGFSECSFDGASNAAGLISSHIHLAHHILPNTNEYASYDYDFSGNFPPLENTSAPQTIKTLMSARFRLSPSQSRPFFIHLLKPDKTSDGFHFLCLLVGPSEIETDARRFLASYYFNSGVGGSPKCVVSWPTLWYRSSDAENKDDVPQFGFRLSRAMLKRIQGNAHACNVFIRIREVYTESSGAGANSLTSDDTNIRWYSNGL